MVAINAHEYIIAEIVLEIKNKYSSKRTLKFRVSFYSYFNVLITS